MRVKTTARAVPANCFSREYDSGGDPGYLSRMRADRRRVRIRAALNAHLPFQNDVEIGDRIARAGHHLTGLKTNRVAHRSASQANCSGGRSAKTGFLRRSLTKVALFALVRFSAKLHLAEILTG